MGNTIGMENVNNQLVMHNDNKSLGIVFYFSAKPLLVGNCSKMSLQPGNNGFGIIISLPQSLSSWNTIW